MRKVVMLVTLSGERHHYLPGEEVEFKAEEAQRLVDANFAKFTDNEPQPAPKAKKAKAIEE